MYTIPGGFGRVHLAPGATPCSCPSFGKALPLLLLLQLANDRIAREAMIMLDVFFIVLNFEGIGKCSDYFDLPTNRVIAKPDFR
jgi:hypothetical protein